MRNRELELKLKLEKTLAHKVRKLLHSNSGGIYNCQLQILLYVKWPNSSLHLPITQACFARANLCGMLISFARNYFLYVLLLFYQHVFLLQDEIEEEVKKYEREVELFHETYDSILAEDKVSNWLNTEILLAINVNL